MNKELRQKSAYVARSIVEVLRSVLKSLGWRLAAGLLSAIGAIIFFGWLASGSSDPSPMIGQGVANTIGGIADLSEAGARYFVVINLPDLGKTPTATGRRRVVPIARR